MLPRPLPTPAPGLRDPRARLRGRRDGHREPQPAAGQRLQGLPRRRRQIVPPADTEIAARIAAVGAARRRPARRRPARSLDEEIVDRYLDTRRRPAPSDGPRDLRIVYTPLHGVGGDDRSRRCWRRAGFAAAARRRRSRTQPDPDFPTVAFPNPEEPGAMDLALALAARARRRPRARQRPRRRPLRRRRARTPHGWRMLRGDEVGALLGRPPARAAARTGTLRQLDRVLARCSARWPPRPG